MRAEALSGRADQVLVGGVSAGWNFFPDKGAIRVEKASGATFVDADGHEYLDFIMGWGSLLLGHSPEPVVAGIESVLRRGFGMQYETSLHVELAELFCSLVPCAEKMRLANSGLEATLYALRIARAATGRSKILKFEGHFHGLHDQLLFGTDTAPTLGEPLADGTLSTTFGSAGIPAELADLILVAPFNDTAALERIFDAHGSDIAGVILEPISLNTGCVAPEPGFLQFLRDLTTSAGTILIFDEVLTGFRVGLAGAQGLFGVTPDLACFGKAFGCGAPIAATAGPAALMDLLTPKGDVEMSGTNTGRLLGVAGALAALRTESSPGFYERLDELNRHLVDRLTGVLAKHDVPAWVGGYGGRVGVHIGSTRPPRDYAEVVAEWNRDFHLDCYRKLSARRLYGFLLPLRACPEPITISAVHTKEQIDRAVEIFDEVLAETPYVERSGAVPPSRVRVADE